MGKGKYEEALFPCSSLNFSVDNRDLGLSLIHISIFYKVFKVFSSVLFTADRHPCQLVCKYGTKVRPYGTVKDGTRCSLDRKIKDVCIGGKCKVRQ